MVGDSTLPIQAALIARLRSDAALTALVGSRIYDRPPDGVDLPYVSLGPAPGEPWEAHGIEGWRLTFQVDSWSEITGRVEARRIMAAIGQSLHRADISIEGHHLVDLRLTLQTSVEDPDGVTVHGVQQFEFITHI